jgi:hypothetical protein
MKAEHRKELQTNTLAANMGRLVQRIKTKPQRRTVLWVALAVAVVAGLIGWYVLHGNRQRQTAELWYMAGNLDERNLKTLLSNWPNTKPGLAARYQYAWLILWNDGIKQLGTSPKAVDSVKAAQSEYKRLLEEAKEDKSLAAEAAYNIALAQESLAVSNPKNLDDAIPLYKRVVDDYGGTAWAKSAQKRLDALKGAESRAEVERIYRLIGPQGFLPFDIQEHIRKMGGKLPPDLGGGP